MQQRLKHEFSIDESEFLIVTSLLNHRYGNMQALCFGHYSILDTLKHVSPGKLISSLCVQQRL
jgi:hypothetical protein